MVVRSGRAGRFLGDAGWIGHLVWPLCLVVLGRPAAAGIAGAGESGGDRLLLDRWRVEDGLPQSSVRAITQTRDGYMWFGTFDGLARFDGVRFTVFHTGNTKGLPSSRILSLLEGRDRTLWIGTEGGGIARLRAGRFETLEFGQPLPSLTVNDLKEDAEGGIWLNAGYGLARIVADRLTVYGPAEGLVAPAAHVFTPRRGGVWVATGRGLLRFERGRLAPIGAGERLGGMAVAAVEVDSEGVAWIGTDKGLLRLRNGDLEIFSAKDGLPGDHVISVLEDRSGTVWVATEGYGLAVFRGGKLELVARARSRPSAVLWGAQGRPGVTQLVDGADGSLWYPASDGVLRIENGVVARFPAPKELSGLEVVTATGDREGSLWLGTHGAGLCRLRRSLFGNLSSGEGLGIDETQCIIESRSGEIWIGTHGGGLSRFDGRRIESFTTRDGLPNDSVWSLCEDPSGDIWIGTWGGLARRSRGRIAPVPIPLALPNVTIISLLVDREGALWIGTFGSGLIRLENGRFLRYTTRDGLANDYVRTIYEDSKGSLWIGTDGGVSHQLENGRFSNITTRDGLSDAFVRPIYEDRDGAFWFGTYGNGLNRWKDGKLTAITTKDGLYDHSVSQILEDDAGVFWMSSNKGIYRVAKKDLDDFADGRLRSISCISYGKAEGMKDAECNGGCQPAGCKARDGRLFFPTAGGVVLIDPRRMRSAAGFPPPVVVEEAVADERPLDLVAPAPLSPGLQRLRLRYTGLSFVNSAKVRFKYRLEGFDRSWVDAGTRREAVYTNLGPGAYVFRVQACSSGGVWNEKGAIWRFEIAPFVYQTLWFRVLAALTAVALVAAVFRVRTRAMREQARRLERLVDERTRALKENQERLLVSEKMASLGRLTAGIAHEMNTPVAAVRASLVELRSLVEEYGASAGNASVTPEDHHEIAGEMGKVIHLAESAAARAAAFLRSVKSQTRDLSTTEKRWFDAGALVSDALLLLGHAVRKAGCTLDVVEPEGKLELHGSPGRLAQVVTNLVANSLDACAPKGGGKVVVVLRQVVGFVEIVVKDDGCGIPPENRSRIFDPMFTTKPFGESTGLGLSIAHDIVTAEYGGSIEVTSEAGEGTTIVVRLPTPAGGSHGPSA